MGNRRLEDRNRLNLLPIVETYAVMSWLYLPCRCGLFTLTSHDSPRPSGQLRLLRTAISNHPAYKICVTHHNFSSQHPASDTRFWTSSKPTT